MQKLPMPEPRQKQVHFTMNCSGRGNNSWRHLLWLACLAVVVSSPTEAFVPLQNAVERGPPQGTIHTPTSRRRTASSSSSLGVSFSLPHMDWSYYANNELNASTNWSSSSSTTSSTYHQYHDEPAPPSSSTLPFLPRLADLQRQRRRRKHERYQQQRSAAAAAVRSVQPYEIYCDLDGVLVDFEAGVRRLFPTEFASSDRFCLQSLHRPSMWLAIQSQEDFFTDLSWQSGGPQLWQLLRHLRPTILTGVPTFVASRTQKVAWCQKHLTTRPAQQQQQKARQHDNRDDANKEMLVATTARHAHAKHVDKAGPVRTHQRHKRTPTPTHDVLPVITCWSDCKHYESGPGKILIDDCWRLKADWEAAGGIFVHHTSLESTVAQLLQLGVLREEEVMQVMEYDEEVLMTL